MSQAQTHVGSFLSQALVLSLLVFSVACTTDITGGGGDDPCLELESALDDCEGADCGSDYLQSLHLECQAQYSEKSDGAKDWVIARLFTRAQSCWDNSDADCMWWVYKALASGSYVNGYADAGRNLNNFLSCGGDLVMSEASFMQDPSFKETLESELLIMQYDLFSIELGESTTFSTSIPMTQDSTRDKLFPAVGRYILAMDTVAYNETPSQDRLEVTFSVRDRYDWNAGQEAEIGGVAFQDDWAAMLVPAKLACDYDITADWTATFVRPKPDLTDE